MVRAHVSQEAFPSAARQLHEDVGSVAAGAFAAGAVAGVVGDAAADAAADVVAGAGHEDEQSPGEVFLGDLVEGGHTEHTVRGEVDVA